MLNHMINMSFSPYVKRAFEHVFNMCLFSNICLTCGEKTHVEHIFNIQYVAILVGKMEDVIVNMYTTKIATYV